MKKIYQIITSVLFASTSIITNAQEGQKTDTVASAIESVQSDVSVLKRIKFSGYVQAQYQKADTIGAASVAGGEFKGFDNRFQIRRARLKAAYTGENTQVVMQLDLKDDGSVKVKEAYGIYTEPLLKTFSLTAGFFNRPIGYEVEYSSGLLETPERSRMAQTLFPDEVDLGVKLTIQAPKTSPLNFIKLDVGLFNGNAIASETDKYKDIIAHLSFKKAVLNENLLLSGGLSYYNGGAASPTNLLYKYNKDSAAFVKEANFNIGDKLGRNYLGIDAQATFSSILGLTTIRGEYLWGNQFGTGSASKSPTGALTASSSKDTKVVVLDTITKKYATLSYVTITPTSFYSREFNGGYLTFIQRIMQSKHELVVRYDWYDPNTKAAGNDLLLAPTISGEVGASTGDMKYTTLGIGWNYYITSNLRFTVYYDMVSNETTSYDNFKSSLKDDPKKKGEKINTNATNNGTTNISKDLVDNVWTIRALYKF